MPPGALGWLAGRDWPGSVCGLRAAVQAAAALAEPGAAVVDAALQRFAAGEEGEEPSVPGGGSLDAAIAGLEA